MADCQRFDSLMTPFIDGALADAERGAVERHVGSCPPCRYRVAVEQAARSLLRTHRTALSATRAPAALGALCADLSHRATIETASGEAVAARWARATAWRTRFAPFALAASLVLLIGGAFLYQATARSSRVMAAELTADHVKCLGLNALLGTRHSPEEIESAMEADFGWRMRLPQDPSSAGLALVGSRPCLYGQGIVAHIMYRHQGRLVSLFMLPGTARAPELVEVLGHEAAIWNVDQRTFVLVSGEPRGEVERMASFVQATLR